MSMLSTRYKEFRDAGLSIRAAHLAATYAVRAKILGNEPVEFKRSCEFWRTRTPEQLDSMQDAISEQSRIINAGSRVVMGPRDHGQSELAADRKRHLMRRLDAQRKPDDGPGTVCGLCLETRNEYGECPCI